MAEETDASAVTAPVAQVCCPRRGSLPEAQQPPPRKASSNHKQVPTINTQTATSRTASGCAMLLVAAETCLFVKPVAARFPA